MAESVDALVSNTSGAIRAGSTPAQGTEQRILNMGILFSISCPSHLIGLTVDEFLTLRGSSMLVYLRLNN